MRRGLVCGLAVIAFFLFLWLGLFPWSTSDEARDAPRPDDKTELEEQAPSVQTVTQRITANNQSPPLGSSSPGDKPGAETEEVVLAGYTLDLSDRPVAGTRVGLFEAEGQCENSVYSFRGLRTIFPRARGSLEDLTPAGLIGIAANVSDQDGYFEFRLHKSPGAYHLRCVGPDRRFYLLAGPFSLSDSPVRLRLQPAHGLRGLIRDAGSETRVVGATVDLIEEDTATRKEDWGHIGERGRARGISDVDGMFRFDLLSPGSYRLEVLHPEYPGVVREVVEIPVEADPFVVTITSTEGGVVISGRVHDAITGFGIGGAEIADFGKYRVISEPSGEYRMHLEEKDVENGKHFTVCASGYGMSTRYFHGRMESQEWDIALHPARRLACHVITEGEQSVSGAKLFVRAKLVTPDGRSNSYHNYYQVTDDDGACTFKDLPAIEKVDLFAFHPTLGTAYYGDVLLHDVVDSEPATVQLVRGPVTVIATVRTLDGQPVSGAQVLLKQPRFNLPDALVRQGIVLEGRFGDLRVAHTGTDGTAKFPDTLPGDCLVQAFGEGFPIDEIDGREDSMRSEVVRFQTEPAGRMSCELVIWRTYNLYGRVRTPEGDALEDVLVNLLSWSEDDRDWVLESPMVSSNEFGNYRFRGLSPVRRFAVAVRPRGMGPELQWKRWKKVSEPEEGDPAEQDYWEAQGFSSSSGFPKDLLFFAEIPAPSEAGESRVDIVLESPPR